VIFKRIPGAETQPWGLMIVTLNIKVKYKATGSETALYMDKVVLPC
jgi:hypothetical protein